MKLVYRRKMVWDEIRQMPLEEILKRRMSDVKNAIHVARGKIRGQVSTEVGLATERRRHVRNLSPEAKKVTRHVTRNLRRKGYRCKIENQRELGNITRLLKISPLRPARKQSGGASKR